MKISEELRRLINEWRNKKDPRPYGHDFVGRDQARHDCADDLEELLDCNPAIDSVEIS